MRVYAETNFVLELVLLQEQHTSCTGIVEDAEAGVFELVLPSFSLIEPYHAVEGRHRARRQLTNGLDRERRELLRSFAYQSSRVHFEELEQVLLRSAEEERMRLPETRARLLAIARLVPLDSAVLSEGALIAERFELSAEDGLILASVLLDLRSFPAEESLFVTKNSKDFGDPDIEALLAEHQCKLLYDFDDALGYGRSRTA